MPYRIEISETEALVLVVYEGVLDGQIFQQSADELRARLRPQSKFDMVTDMTRANFTPMSSYTILKLRDQAASEHEATALFGSTTRRAIVISSNLGFGFARMYQLMRNDAEDKFRVFRDLGEAYEWLGRKVPVSVGS